MKDSSYPPSVHLENDLNKLTPLMRQYPFATVISAHNGEVEVTQAPLVFEEIDEKLFLYGHLADNNIHGDHLDKSKVTVIFHGPNCYISPNDYATKQLPTWNSLSVHVKGHCQTTKAPEELFKILEMLTKQFEQGSPSDKADYKIERTEEKTARLIHHITGFTIEVTDIIGRYKLSQDKSEEDIALSAKKIKESTKKGADDLVNRVLQKFNH